MNALNPSDPVCCFKCMTESGRSKMGVFLVCGTCGNKRCPKATDHNLTCTDSNEPGQPGSRFTNPFADTPQEQQEGKQ